VEGGEREGLGCVEASRWGLAGWQRATPAAGVRVLKQPSQHPRSRGPVPPASLPPSSPTVCAEGGRQGRGRQQLGRAPPRAPAAAPERPLAGAPPARGARRRTQPPAPEPGRRHWNCKCPAAPAPVKSVWVGPRPPAHPRPPCPFLSMPLVSSPRPGPIRDPPSPIPPRSGDTRESAAPTPAAGGRPGPRGGARAARQRAAAACASAPARQRRQRSKPSASCLPSHLTRPREKGGFSGGSGAPRFQRHEQGAALRARVPGLGAGGGVGRGSGVIPSPAGYYTSQVAGSSQAGLGLATPRCG
jgi:hypothetical protein